jgi:hypothetical protein
VARLSVKNIYFATVKKITCKKNVLNHHPSKTFGVSEEWGGGANNGLLTEREVCTVKYQTEGF